MVHTQVPTNICKYLHVEKYLQMQMCVSSLCQYTARPIDLLRDMPQFVIIEPKHSAKQNYVHDGSLAHFKIDASVLDLKSERALYSHVYVAGSTF